MVGIGGETRISREVHLLPKTKWGGSFGPSRSDLVESLTATINIIIEHNYTFGDYRNRLDLLNE